MLAAYLLLLAATVVQAASILTLESPKYTISSADGTQLKSQSLSLSTTQKTLESLTLSSNDVLKLSFQVVDKESRKGVQPQQTFLRFYDEESREEGVQPVRITSSGKVNFVLNMAKPPSSLPPTSTAPLKVTLLLGGSSYSPLKQDLFELYVPASQPAQIHPDEASFHPLPVIEHTFHPEPKLPPRVISAFFAGAVVLAPWSVLLGLWTTVSPRLPRLLSPTILPFTFTLAAFEGLLYWYWVDLKLGDVLLYGAGLGIVTVFTGKHALSSIAERRLGRK